MLGLAVEGQQGPRSLNAGCGDRKSNLEDLYEEKDIEQGPPNGNRLSWIPRGQGRYKVVDRNCQG